MMTSTKTTIGSSTDLHPAGAARLRALTAALHLVVTLLALFSLSSNRFDLWVDLRWLGTPGAALTRILWTVTTLLVPCCAGPWLTGWRRPTWINVGWSARWARRLLWPSYFVAVILVVNTIQFSRLWWMDRIDTRIPLPITLPAVILLAAWAFFTRKWLRIAVDFAGRGPALPRATLKGAIFIVAALLAFGDFFLVQLYHRPPRQPVDLAVVLGYRVLPDGTASVTLRDRTLAAIGLYKRGLARHLFLSGSINPPQIPGGPSLNEALAMRQVCLDNGVPAAAITLDSHGVNTRATAANACAYLRARGLKSVVACSDDYHLLRTVQSFRALGIDACSTPSTRSEWPCAEPQAVLRELVAIVVYKLDPWYRASKEVAMSLSSPRVVVHKIAGLLEIYDGPGPGTLVQTYACITGGRPGDKSVEGDRKTPIGTFHVVFKNPDSKYHLSLGLDYPNAEDALRGLRSGLIKQAEYDGILQALESDLSREENQKKLWYTALGGEIFIHGEANGRPGTSGCMAVSNPDIEEIYAALPVGTVVEIRP